jgi:hypothetical protein
MQSLTGKETGDSLTASEWNQLPSEVQNVIEDLGQTLSSGDLNQLGKAIAGYVAGGDFYVDSGSSGSFELSVVGDKQAPTEYFNGFRVRFVAADDATGSDTINVAGIGSIDFKNSDGSDLSSDIVASGYPYEAYYDSDNTEFRLSCVNQYILDNAVEALEDPSVTGTATFTNSTQNIYLEGIGDLTGLEVGDVIQVSGSTSNDTEYTVESITDSDNIIVNYEHRGQTTTKALTDETSTSDVTVTLLCKWYNAPSGLGQGWCTPASSRISGSDYINSVGRQITVGIVFSAASAQWFTVDDVNIVRPAVENDAAPATIPIPGGSTYKASSGLTITIWSELR